MSENEELELEAKAAELDKRAAELDERAAELDERENWLNEIKEQLRIKIDAFNQEKEAYLKNQKEFEDFIKDREVLEKELDQKVKESLRTYEKEQKELILETIGKQNYKSNKNLSIKIMERS
ncbi:hypothetical protein [Helicobacter pylori]|uniref:hypothetical protein n=1 Tax=Helicobacter pylori TaxID=210 RepID=UPI001E2C7C0A|nr:hypothetical protein [Helicobacter pylori]